MMMGHISPVLLLWSPNFGSGSEWVGDAAASSVQAAGCARAAAAAPGRWRARRTLSPVGRPECRARAERLREAAAIEFAYRSALFGAGGTSLR